MPSAFIKDQAELLYRTKDTFGVLQRIRDKYALSSFPSQMSRVKEEWYQYQDRHENYEKMYSRGLQSLVNQQVSARFISQYRQFHKDIKSGLKSRDYVKVSEVAHALKGASGNLRCCSLYRAASDLELYTKVGQDERKSKRKANLVLKEIQRVVESITSYYYAWIWLHKKYFEK